MVDSFVAESDQFVVVRDDKVSFDTAHPSLMRLPPSTHIDLTGHTITFPSYLQKKAYYRNGRFPSESICELWATLVWQEWGPNEVDYNESVLAPTLPTTRNLPRVLLGTVPAETTYLDVQVNLTRTTTPPASWGIEIPLLLFKEGEWIALPGGSCPTELIGDVAVRHFNIVRDGNSIYLDRYMSVRNASTALAPGGFAQADLRPVGGQNGWNSSMNIAELSNGRMSDDTGGPWGSNYYINTLIQRKGFDTSGNKRPGGGTNTCSGNWPDLTTVLTGDISIVPCIYKTS
jgi:hypothetical protein